ncbi:MAG: AAA family ATPase [Rhodocyclaceae bacterium]|nr:AAA family ATPase [Rhodocyclaceae bacterium]
MPNVPPAIIEALSSPCEEVIETHISWVLLAGEYAYKVKKPVTLPFLDYATLEKRRACCEEELRLNRRFAPALYLGVVTLAGEPAVVMRRFAANRRLDHLCERGELSEQPLLAFARELAQMQAQMPIAEAGTPYGEPAAILSAALENFEELERMRPDLAPRWQRLKNWTSEEGAARAGDFRRRKAAGRVREGHGDLHLANLVLLEDRIVPFDAIEFSAAFRIIDVASEIAFLLLDLLEHGEAGLASAFLSEWLVWSGDFEALVVLRFYLVYRAMVRAKVAALQAKEKETEAYLRWAEALISPPLPALTITFGPSGSGKTYLSGRRLLHARMLDCVRFRSDVERKRLYGLAPNAASGGSIYTPAATLRTYARLAELAELAISHGWSVIVDAAFLRRAERMAFQRLAKRLGVPFAILAPSADVAEMEKRIRARQGDASEATVEVLRQQLACIEPLSEEEKALTQAD